MLRGGADQHVVTRDQPDALLQWSLNTPAHGHYVVFVRRWHHSHMQQNSASRSRPRTSPRPFKHSPQMFRIFRTPDPLLQEAL